LREKLREVVAIDFPIEEWAQEEGIADEEIRERVRQAADELYAGKREKWGGDIMGFVEKQVLLQTLDHLWREHLVVLEHLRQAVGLRGYGQRDPLNEYKTEGFNLFESMIIRLREMTSSQLMRVEIADRPPEGLPLEDELPAMEAHHMNPFTGQDDMVEAALAFAGAGPAALSGAAEAALLRAGDVRQPSSWGKVGRNEQCPCGSGKKYKHCHGAFA
jgi:preprotein translocase subunit SecA